MRYNSLAGLSVLVMRKEDRRNAYTRQAIRDTVFSLLEKKPIERITVTEVCKIAEINRSTFYLHYMDCMDVLEKEQDQFCDRLIDVMERTRHGKPLDIVEELNRMIREDHNVYLLLMRSGQPLRSFSKFTDYCRNYLTKGIGQHCALSEAECDWVSQYIIAGSFAISTLFAEEKDFNREREEIFHILTTGGIEALTKAYPKK